MTPARKQLCHILLLRLLLLFDSVHASFKGFDIIPGAHGLAQQVLTTLVSGPLSDHDLLLVTDDHTQRLLDLDQVVEAAGSSLTPVLLATQHSLLHTHRPAHHTKGSLLTALLLFHQDPTDFLLLLADNINWNPSYLVLFCLNPHLNTTTVLSQPVVQRSQFILLLHPAVQDGRQRLLAYTSLPMQVVARDRPVSKLLGIWSPNYLHTRQSLFPPRFQDFGGEVLELSLVCYGEPFVYLDENNNCIGMNLDALLIMGNKLNFSITSSTPEGLEWGVKHNGTWNGMLGQLMYEGKHLIINLMQNNPDRFIDFDFTYPYWEDHFAFLLRIPPPLPQWKNVLYPFSSLMWGLVFVTTLLVASLLALLLHRINNLEDTVGIALKIASGLLSQASPMLGELQESWVRLWLVCWWLTVDILCSMYTGNLVAVLTIPAYPPVLHTVEDVGSTDLRPAMLDYGSFLPDALKNSKNPTLATMGKKIYLDPIDLSDPYGYIVKNVLDGTFTAIITIDYLTMVIHRKKLWDSIYIMDETLYENYISWFLPRHTPYTSTLSDHLIRLMETGILAKLYRKHVGSYTEIVRQVRGDGVLNLDHLQGGFIVLGPGLVIATFTLLMERLANPRSSPPLPQ